MAALFDTGIFSALGVNSSLLTGAKLFFYSAGTSAKLATYTTSGLSIANSNPVVADGNGRFPEIWLQDASYKYILAPSNDTDPPTAAIVTRDNYTTLATSLSASSGASLISFIQSGAGAVARTAQSKMREAISAADFDLNASGSGDVANVAKFQAFLTAAAGRVAFLPAGTYNLDSATLALIGLVVPSGTTIFGEGRDNTKIVVTGASQCYLFMVKDVSRVTISDLWCYGNGVATASGPGGPIYVWHSTGASAHMTDITVRDCKFENFKGDYWLNFYAQNTTYSLSRARVENNVFISASGNARNGASTAVPSTCVNLTTDTTAKIYDCRVTGNTAYCDYIKSFCLTWAGCNRFLIADNEVINAGTDASISDDSAAYAFMSYNGTVGSNRPTSIRYARNRVYGVRDCALYITDIDGLEVDEFYFANQTSTADATLPKGGIALNATLRANISNVRAGGSNARGIMLAGAASTDDWEFRNIDLGGACAQPVKYSSISKTARIVFDGLRAQATSGRAIFIQVTATSGPERLEIQNFDIKGTASAALGFGVTGTPTFKHWRIADGRVGDFGITANGLASTASPVIIENVLFEDTWSATSISLDVSNSKNVRLKNLHFVGAPTLYHLNTGGTTGTLTGVTFSDCATGKFSEGSSNLGRTTPNWAGSPGDFVQNINEPTEAGAVGTKYVLTGWRFTSGTTWVAERTPTSNNTATA